MPKVKITSIVILILFLVWLSLYNPPILNRVRLSAVNLFTLPLRITQTVSRKAKNYLEIRLYNKWIRENVELRNRLKEQSFELAKLKELESENERLMNLLEFKRQSAERSISASVIGMDSALLSRSIIIDRGRRDGIQAGMAVISKKGIVGRVADSSSSISRVMLLEDPDFRLGVIVQRTREQGLFVGGPYGKSKIIYLEAGSDVKEGDAVVSFPSTSAFPKGLLLGHIKDVESEGISLYKSATVEISVDYSRLEEVLCVK